MYQLAGHSLLPPHTNTHVHTYVMHTHICTSYAHMHTSTYSVRTVYCNGLTSRRRVHCVEHPSQVTPNGEMAQQPHGLNSSELTPSPLLLLSLSLSHSSFTAVSSQPYYHESIICDSMCNAILSYYISRITCMSRAYGFWEGKLWL